ncbi:N-acetyl-1-D-myo-inositol-2-amino-2-deoxy-alpha-D-glucopyranoside deacetylase [Tsukamurella sp. 8F]|uniref:N-acetyl-1-D-myo-inositol-2-amino-2-deoxy-alpha- D-glucopyranoside deacetylase n=1 Tax=unclassified Tsukamurella TaxID=2633480 RepID=UPI0023B8E265|nr:MULTISPECIES: N-acetyl-1-D-myo-inositol-2-amino-2-deoxy-alpha-D-glucopyranoside deacetylase [unclassified Tsukamurella]MDF0530077.1 N-acetyl-1-D-myo-inositol-2-amino-2-deoxy-alpha-D-glucopyranoside deacetylase [Tsukamurella sp. 8J]MDF0586395.1 N-acetyl-1-D-myo-inositol-2-amino-2-deoxy-alpha-D-glucopyranoside deacetylase [Tsukamurella sp. 8F]
MPDADPAAARRLMLVHAHPDDESITTGGTIARYLAEGAEVTVVTCTLGEVGETMDDEHALLTYTEADQLGGWRAGELRAALAALSPAGAPLSPLFLGGIGRWRDSGMADMPTAAHPRAFVNAPKGSEPGTPVAQLAALIREQRPHVVITYDTVGGYGHPDHIAAHRATFAALTAAADPAYPGGAAWDVPKAYWTVSGEGQLTDGVLRLQEDEYELPDGWHAPGLGTLPTHPDDELTTLVDVSGVLDRKIAALRAHATQLHVAPSGTEFALTNRVAQPVLDAEAYVLVRGEPGERYDGYERDLFAGLG